MSEQPQRPSRFALFCANTLLVVASLAVFCGLMELSVRIAYPLFANYNLEMWRYFRDMKKRLPAGDPMSFYHHANKSGHYYGVDVEINEYGIRDDPISEAPQAGVTRIVLLGDSFVFGWGVPFDEMMGQQLEQMLNAHPDYAPCEVINLGVGNYNAKMQAALLERKGMPLHPDAVILNYFVNDTERTPRLSLPAYYVTQSSYANAVLFDQFVSIWPLIDPSYRWDEYYASLYLEENPALQANADGVRQIIELCKQAGIPLIICSYPELRQLKDYPFPMATDFIRRLAAEGDTPFVDLLPLFEPHEPESLWVSFEDTHGNSKASAIAAQAMYDAVRELAPHAFAETEAASEAGGG